MIRYLAFHTLLPEIQYFRIRYFRKPLYSIRRALTGSTLSPLINYHIWNIALKMAFKKHFKAIHTYIIANTVFPAFVQPFFGR